MPNTLKRQNNALLVLDSGAIFYGYGFGAENESVGELCFNTSMTGYQEILTDPSYAGQIINFTFPHIGNVGTNPIDMETGKPSVLGLITRNQITEPSNWRNTQSFSEWLKKYNIPGISGIDTRALTRKIRDEGAKTALLSYKKNADFNFETIKNKIAAWPGLKDMDLAKTVTCSATTKWSGGLYRFDFEQKLSSGLNVTKKHKVIAIDFGAKHNILRCLETAGCEVILLPANTTANDVLSYNPDGIFLSNGPGDPEATSKYSGSEIRTLVETGIPLFGICIGHQLSRLHWAAAHQKWIGGIEGQITL